MTRALLLLVALCFGPPAAGQELGRLFFTPEQRATLDARRRARVPDTPAAIVVTSPTTRVDGFVRRSGGPATVWVNGAPLGEKGPDAPRIVRDSADPRVSIPVGEAGVRFSLKPGQELDRSSGEIRDVLSADDELRIRRAK